MTTTDEPHKRPRRKRTTVPGTFEQAIARTLAEIAKEKGLTQTDVADAVSLSQAMISEIFSGNRSMTVSELDRMCRVLGVAITEVVARAES